MMNKRLILSIVLWALACGTLCATSSQSTEAAYQQSAASNPPVAVPNVGNGRLKIFAQNLQNYYFNYYVSSVCN
jgi:curli biogenesis system outer membrane secretion channel CsgG